MGSQDPTSSKGTTVLKLSRSVSCNLFPQWKNSMFVGGLRGALLDRLEIVNDKVVAEEPLLAEMSSRIRDVRVGPDGAVYVLTDSGTPTMSPNTPPTSKLLKLTPE